MSTFASERIERSFKTLEKVLETRTFLVGERLTLADLSVAPLVLFSAKYYLDQSNIHKFSSLVRFVETVLNQPQIAHLWTVQWPDKILTYTPPPKEPKKKEAEPEDDDDDLVPKEEPKAKHPLESLAKSPFNLEDWKRAYSNKDTRGPGGALEWFYEK